MNILYSLMLYYILKGLTYIEVDFLVLSCCKCTYTCCILTQLT